MSIECSLLELCPASLRRAFLGLVSAGLASLCLVMPAAAADEFAEPRWLPASCDAALHGLSAAPDARSAARWNRDYRAGIEAIGVRDLDRAEALFCRSLQAARSFPAEDLRFAETLDELGLVFYLRADLENAEAMQGAAVTERLLSVGAPRGLEAEVSATSCLSSVGVYLKRLGWIAERQGWAEEHASWVAAPYRILAARYIPDRVVRSRIDGLIATYLLLEDYAAADWLTAWQDELSVPSDPSTLTGP
ncbi:MAG: hypothetical protein AAGN46_01870 [Acidobacteriota bacterium]